MREGPGCEMLEEDGFQVMLKPTLLMPPQVGFIFVQALEGSPQASIVTFYRSTSYARLEAMIPV